MSAKSDDLRREAKEAGERANKSKSLRDAVNERKRQKGLTQLANNEDWLDGERDKKD